MANVVADKLTQANQIKERIRTAANAKNAGIPEGAPFADYPGYLEGLPEQVENMPIALDFSGGDQTITAAEGTVVKSAVIQKPANLTPENIAEGVDIAGIVGALAGGGGGAIHANGTFKASGTTHTLNHNLGRIPDFFLFFVRSGFTSPTTGAAIFAVGVNESFGSLLGKTSEYQWCRYYNSSSTTTKSSTSSAGYPIENTGYYPISSATETTVVLGKDRQLVSNGTYEWFAIGGLT